MKQTIKKRKDNFTEDKVGRIYTHTEKFEQGTIMIKYEFPKRFKRQKQIHVISIIMPSGELIPIKSHTNEDSFARIVKAIFQARVESILRNKHQIIEDQGYSADFDIGIRRELCKKFTKGYKTSMRVLEKYDDCDKVALYKFILEPLDIFNPETWHPEYTVERMVLSTRKKYELSTDSALTFHLEWPDNWDGTLEDRMAYITGHITTSSGGARAIFGILEITYGPFGRMKVTLSVSKLLNSVLLSSKAKGLKELELALDTKIKLEIWENSPEDK